MRDMKPCRRLPQNWCRRSAIPTLPRIPATTRRAGHRTAVRTASTTGHGHEKVRGKAHGRRCEDRDVGVPARFRLAIKQTKRRVKEESWCVL